MATILLRKYTTPDGSFSLLWDGDLDTLTQLLEEAGITEMPTQEDIKEQLYNKLVEEQSKQDALKVYLNPNNLNGLIVGSRIAALDSQATVITPDVLINGNKYVVVKSVLSDLEINNVLAYPQTTQETADLAAYASSISNFNAIDADWPTKSADDLITTIDGIWFSGKTLAQIQSDINGSANYKVAMNQLASYLYTFRDNILHKQIRAEAALRDYLIRVKRLASAPQIPNKR